MAAFFAPLFAVRSDFPARFIFARLIGNLPVESRAPPPGRETAGRTLRQSAPPCYPSTDDAHAAAPAQLFHTAQETAVRHHIIAFGFHHYHEIAFALHVEEHLCLALALAKERMQRIDRAAGRAPERNPYPERLRQGHASFVERNDV